MERSIIISVQLSSLYPLAQSAVISLQTSRQNAPLPPPQKDTGPPTDHALHASVLHIPEMDTIILRVIDNGLVIELVPLSGNATSLRFIFPSPVLKAPAIFLLQESSELHVLAITQTASLYRVVLPIGNGHDLWKNQLEHVWYNEHLIKSVENKLDGLVHVQGPHAIAVALQSGSLLRLETGNNENDGWTENVYHQGSFLSTLTSFLPSLHGSASNGSEVVSMASHLWPTDIGHLWTLSRDRTLRLWRAKVGCIATKMLSPTQDTSSSPEPLTGAPLLEVPQQTLLRVFSGAAAEDHVYVLAFIPTITSSTSGGSFELFMTFSDQLHKIGVIECSKSTAYCHLQDFLIFGNALYTLWDHEGQSFVERTYLDLDKTAEQSIQISTWCTASYAREPELTPSYLEELLLSPGALSDRFLEAVMRPGMFSNLTLRTAIDQYANACLTLPGPCPPQLSTSYATLTENIAAVVGCTVNLVRDPHTGAPQYVNYWTALKRDWEGFIARCREIERSARWPLMLGVHEGGGIILVERERVGLVVTEDLPLSIHRTLGDDQTLETSTFGLFQFLWTVRSKLSLQGLVNLEGRLMDILHQEIAFSIPDILQDQARRVSLIDDLDDGFTSWVFGRLQGMSNLALAFRNALDLIGGFEWEVKREENDSDLLLSVTQSLWTTALAGTYSTATVHARYDLLLTLMLLLYLLADELSQWDPSLLADAFAVFRAIAMLRYITRQPAAEQRHSAKCNQDMSADEVADRLRDMQFSRTSRLKPSYSLVHRLLAESSCLQSPPEAAHKFLEQLGLLQSVSPAHVSRYEVRLCERLRLMGYHEVAREMLAWLPRTPAVTFVVSQLWIDIGRPDDASQLLEKLAGCFGLHSGLSVDDREAFKEILPGASLFDSEFSFYLHAMTLFGAHSLVHHEVSFAKLALSVAPSDADTSELWNIVIKGYTDLRRYDDAYAALMASPYNQKRDCISQLVYRICEDNAVEKLVAFGFTGCSDEVEDALSFKARNVDPRLRPFYSKILYTWYLSRGDYRSAASSMYQRARKIHELLDDPAFLTPLVNEQVEAYITAINVLSLVDSKQAWIVLPCLSSSNNEPRKRRKLSRYIPDSKFASTSHDVEIVDLADMQHEYILLLARLDLVRKDPSLLSSGELLLPPSSIVLRLAQSNRFNTALATARSFGEDMTDVFTHLTTQCLRLTHNPDVVIQEDTSDWLLTDQVSSWPGTHADKGWRHLRQSLQRYDGPTVDFKYSKVVLETILTFDGSSSPPPWLTQSLEDHCPEHLIRTFLRYENIDNAIEHTLSLMRKTEVHFAEETPKHAASTWLPYTLIDQVLAAAASQSQSPAKLAVLQTELANRVKRMQKHSKFS